MSMCKNNGALTKQIAENWECGNVAVKMSDRADSQRVRLLKHMYLGHKITLNCKYYSKCLL